MTPHQINMAMAQACGWVGLRLCVESKCGVVGYNPADNPFPHDKGEQDVPNYYEDLNSCHEAEKTLTPDEQYHYGDMIAKSLRDAEDAALGEKTGKKWKFNGMGYFDLAHLSAPQRCESFLRVKNLWVE